MTIFDNDNDQTAIPSKQDESSTSFICSILSKTYGSIPNIYTQRIHSPRMESTDTNKVLLLSSTQNQNIYVSDGSRWPIRWWFLLLHKDNKHEQNLESRLVSLVTICNYIWIIANMKSQTKHDDTQLDTHNNYLNWPFSRLSRNWFIMNRTHIEHTTNYEKFITCTFTQLNSLINTRCVLAYMY